jgi:hypothetical protein
MGTTLRLLVVTLLVPVVLIAALAGSAIAGEKETLCHLTGNGSYRQITVSVNAVPAHMRHGDVPVDDYGDCP